MKHILIFLFIFIFARVKSQNKKIDDPKVFWKEDFNSANLPDGWYIPTVGKWDPRWVVTNQPYPGSYQYQQQAPPIASNSRGYHLQFQAGCVTRNERLSSCFVIV